LYTATAPHSGVGVTVFNYKVSSIIVATATPGDLVDGKVRFTHVASTSGQSIVTIEAVGPGGTKSVSDTLRYVTPAPAPPDNFGGPLTVEQ
jgi:hypothetical protein